MTCKDCIHYEVCCDEYELAHAENCNNFKDKSKYIELPNVEIGQVLFYVDKYTKSVESDIVSKLTWEETYLGVDTGIWSENYGFSEFFSDIGKTVFLTREEAEQKLKELKENA